MRRHIERILCAMAMLAAFALGHFERAFSDKRAPRSVEEEADRARRARRWLLTY